MLLENVPSYITVSSTKGVKLEEDTLQCEDRPTWDLIYFINNLYTCSTDYPGIIFHWSSMDFSIMKNFRWLYQVKETSSKENRQVRGEGDIL